jgi:hypothetical protein
VTTTELKADIDAAVAAVTKIDRGLPGAARLNALVARLQACAEKPLVLTLLTALLSEEGA